MYRVMKNIQEQQNSRPSQQTYEANTKSQNGIINADFKVID
jgi:hypothetical protein